MKFKVVIFFLLIILKVAGQDKMSKADALFFGFNYKEAILEYQKELKKKPLNNQQYLNLADAYAKIGNYDSASKNYLEVFKKDSTFSNHYFNKMLLSFSEINQPERIKAFLATKSTGLPKELLENTEFNTELITSNIGSEVDFEIFNISANTAQADFSPSFYIDKLLFTSGRSQKETYKPSGESYLDIFVARIEQEGKVNSASPFTGIANSYFHKATPYYSDKLKSVLYVSSNAEGKNMLYSEEGKNTLAIGKQILNGDFVYLLRDLNTSFYYPFYDADSDILYFSANFEDGYGGTDIYYVHTNDGQIMSAPINMGPRINSPGNEISPFIFENSLYFASDIFYGLGGMDVYKSNIHEEGDYSIPINLGAGINSTDDDFGFIIKNYDNNGLLGYFSSNRKGGKGNDDIYGFNVAEKPGLKTIAVRGKVLKPDGRTGVEKVAIRVLDKDNQLLTEAFTNEEGGYQFEIPWREQITVLAEKELYSAFNEKYIDISLENIQKDGLAIEMTFLDDIIEEKESQKVIKLNKFFFARGRSVVTAEIAIELNKVVEVVKKFPEFQLRIESHTNSKGGSSTNFRLSQSRSNAIKDYLLLKGVPSSNILYTMGYGEDKITNNCTNGVYCLDMLHKQNERSLIVVLNHNLIR